MDSNRSLQSYDFRNIQTYFTYDRSVVTLFLSKATQGMKVVYHHVKVFLFEKVIDLKKILCYKAIAFTAFQKHFNVFTLLEGCVHGVDLFHRSWSKLIDESKNEKIIVLITLVF